MQKKIIIIIILAILLAAGFLYISFFKGNSGNESSVIYGNGIIEAKEVNISSRIPGKIQKSFIKEGGNVRANQLLFRLDSKELDGQVLQAEANLQIAQANLSELIAGTRKEEILKARAQYDSAMEALKQANARYALLKEGPRKEQIAQLKAQYQMAKSRLSLIKGNSRKAKAEELRDAVKKAEAALREMQSEKKNESPANTPADSEKNKSGNKAAGSSSDDEKWPLVVLMAAKERLAEADIAVSPDGQREAEEALELARQRLDEAEHGARYQELRVAESAVKQAEDQASAAKAMLDMAIAGPGPQALSVAKGRIKQAQGVLMVASANKEYAEIHSPLAGRVTYCGIEPGEMILPGMTIAKIAALEKVWLKVYIPGPQVEKVFVNQKAKITTDGGGVYEGRVIEIAEEPEFTPKNVQTRYERAKLVYGVKIEINNPEYLLKPGMPADAILYEH
ncbi:MAG: efflux RND transporter periplasmic adaptor subunit [Firmicutes bacterium]|nr:efflux RND transporter periplasmic adaptor subunit [Bacillota bacterium]